VKQGKLNTALANVAAVIIVLAILARLLYLIVFKE